MYNKTPVLTDKAPKPRSVLNQAIIANGLVFCSGSLPQDPVTGNIIPGDIKAHTHRCIQNLTAVLEAAGTTINHVVKVNIFLASLDDFDAMNEVYGLYWGDVKPCRTCVAVKTLPKNVDVEIECTAVLPKGNKL